MAHVEEAISEFRPCVSHEGYEVDESGVVRNRESGRTLQHFLLGGYPAVTLKVGVRTYRPTAVHRLVAKTWLLPDPDPARTIVNHKDLNKLNCRASNLEWVTQKENVVHALRRFSPEGQQQRGKAIESIDAEGNIKQYISVSEAARANGISASTLTSAINHGTTMCKNLWWRTIELTELPQEEWQRLRECDGHVFKYKYHVSNLGRLMGPKGFTKPATGTNGYLYCSLVGQDGSKKHALHRLVATAFLGPAPGPNDVPNHIDEDKTNNVAANLCWVTRTENSTSALGRSVVQKTLDAEFVARFSSVTLAAKAVDRTSSALCSAIRRGGTCGGCCWSYEEPA